MKEKFHVIELMNVNNQIFTNARGAKYEGK